MSFACKKLTNHKTFQTSWEKKDLIGNMLLGQEGGLMAVSLSGMPQIIDTALACQKLGNFCQ